MLPFYNLLSTVGLALYLPRLLFKKGPERRSEYIRERLGLSDYTKTDIWVHAVSVGEVLACVPFLKALKKEFPSKKIVLTTTTYTGQKIAQERFSEADRVMYMPLDASVCIRRVVALLKPELFIAAETELWPALFFTLKEIGSRIVILNGRISNPSYKGYKRISFIMRKVLANVDYLFMQTKRDAERIIDIGADRNRVGIMGNFKFDIEMDENTSLSWQERIKGDAFLAASTHKGEEEIVLDAYESIKKRVQSTEYKIQSNNNRRQTSGLTLIIAPRHPKRFEEVAEMLEQRGLKYIRRSEITELSDSSSEQSASTDNKTQRTDTSFPEVILLDTMGELPRVFAGVTVAFIGGSLVPTGGHNMLEPAYYSKPIIFGPHMDNFPIAKNFLTSSAAIEVQNSTDISNAVLELLNDRKKAENMGRNARQIIEDNTGAVKKAIELVRGFIGTV